MASTPKQRLTAIQKELKAFNWTAVAQRCEQLIDEIFTDRANFSVDDFYALMKALRRKRQFRLMIQLGDALVINSKANSSVKIHYAQALIEETHYSSAISVLEKLDAEIVGGYGGIPSAVEEYAETKGILGRAYKQLFIRSGYSSSGTGLVFLKKGIGHYLSIYQANPTLRTWHGINAVALVALGERHGIALSGFPEFKFLASKILETLEQKNTQGKADAWDYATAAECCLALEDPTEALRWLAGYSSHPDCDAFELASTLRQMEEIWELDLESQSGQLLLPLLRAELLKRSGGQFEVNPEEIRKELAVGRKVSKRYEALLEKKGSKALEKVFSSDSFKTYKWYMQGAARCLGVARIGIESSIGEGTGFLIRGTDLHDSLGDELVLLTNAHVVSEDPLEKAISPDEAVVIFEVLDASKEFNVQEIIWSSPSTKLDTAILRFSKAQQAELKALTEHIEFYPLSPALPVITAEQKVYIIGHPKGGTLQLSFQDNQLLDHENPKIHYRTPTDKGSSGSPIFAKNWALLGLHHAGSDEMKCLNGKQGVYSANEGIWIKAIIAALAEDLK